jgi:hypothetical protein
VRLGFVSGLPSRSIIQPTGIYSSRCASSAPVGRTSEGTHKPGAPRDETAEVEFIDENGGGPGVRLRKRHQKKG